MALSRVVSEIFNVEKCRDLEIGVKGHSRSLKVVPCDRAYITIYALSHGTTFNDLECSLVTLSLNRTVFEIFDL